MRNKLSLLLLLTLGVLLAAGGVAAGFGDKPVVDDDQTHNHNAITTLARAGASEPGPIDLPVPVLPHKVIFGAPNRLDGGTAANGSMGADAGFGAGASSSGDSIEDAERRIKKLIRLLEDKD